MVCSRYSCDFVCTEFNSSNNYNYNYMSICKLYNHFKLTMVGRYNQSVFCNILIRGFFIYFHCGFTICTSKSSKCALNEVKYFLTYVKSKYNSKTKIVIRHIYL